MAHREAELSRRQTSTTTQEEREGKPMADAILYWNGVALESNRISHSNGAEEQTGPPLSARALAIAHLAMYDAFLGADTASGGTGTDPHYLPAAELPTAKAGASPDAAVAAALLTRRKDDPGASPVGYTVKNESGKWRPDPDNPMQMAHAPHYGELCTPFATQARYTLAPPPAVSTSGGEYRRAL